MEEAGSREPEAAGQANPVDLIITELPAAKRRAVKTVRDLRKQMPGAAVIVILGGGRRSFP